MAISKPTRRRHGELSLIHHRRLHRSVGEEARELTEQAAEDAQACRVSGPVQEGHQAAPGAQVFLPEAKDPLHPASRRCFVRL